MTVLSPRVLGVVAGDTHLAPTTWAKHPTLRGDAYCGLSQLVTQSLHYEAPLLLLGDTFDRDRPDSETVTVFCREMDRMQEAGLAVYYIQGNHDGTKSPWPAVHAWPTWVHQQQFMLGPFRCYGLDYTPRGRLQEALAAVPANTWVLLTHQAWEELQGIGNTDGSFRDVHHARYLFTGDYHVHTQWAGQAATGALDVFSPGSTCMQAINERPSKSFFLLSFDSDRGLQVSSQALVTRAFLDLMIESPAYLADAVSHLATARPEVMPAGCETLAKPIVRVRYHDSVPDVYARLSEAAGDHFHIFWEPAHVREDVTVGVPAEMGTDFDTLETTLEYMRSSEGISQATYDAAVRLLRSQDADADLTAMAAAFRATYDHRGGA